MASTRPATRPIVVCGASRSGTTFIGELLRTSPDVELLPELSHESLPSLFGLLDELRRTLQWQRWKAFSEDDIEARVVEVLHQVWRSGRRLHFHELDRPRFGLKQPWAENLHAAFDAALGRFSPQWVYALRSPAAVYASNLRMAGAPEWSPLEFRDRYAASLQNALLLAQRGDLFVFDMDASTVDEEHRRRAVADLFAFLGVSAGPWASWFTGRWGPVNAGTSVGRGPLPEAEVEQRVAAFMSPASFAPIAGLLEQLRTAARRHDHTATSPLPVPEPLPAVAGDAPPDTRRWNEFYAAGGMSAAEPFGAEARFKAEVVEQLLHSHGVSSVIEFGVGDGLQLSQIEYPDYLGLDISPVAIRFCEWLFEGDLRRRFRVCEADELIEEQADLAVSLDVIYRLPDDAVYATYMRNLFSCASRLVVIYSTDRDATGDEVGVRHRAFSSWVASEAPEWRLDEQTPFEPSGSGDTAPSFFVYTRR